jgi:hypothetical protein
MNGHLNTDELVDRRAGRAPCELPGLPRSLGRNMSSERRRFDAQARV